MNPKIQIILVGFAAFCLSFGITFAAFGGIAKLKHYYSNKAVVQKETIEEENSNQNLQSGNKETENQQEPTQSDEKDSDELGNEEISLQNPFLLDNELFETETESELNTDTGTNISSEGDENIDNIIDNFLESETETANNTEADSLSQENTLTVDEVVEKFQNVLHLSENEEWNNLSIEIRKEAYEIMSENRETNNQGTEDENNVSSETEIGQTEQNTSPEEQSESDDASVNSKLSEIDKLFIGQESNNETFVEPTEEVSESTTNNGWTEYTIVSGDSWNALARKYGITTQELQEANPGKTQILLGDTLMVPAQ